MLSKGSEAGSHEMPTARYRVSDLDFSVCPTDGLDSPIPHITHEAIVPGSWKLPVIVACEKCTQTILDPAGSVASRGQRLS